MRFIQCVFLLVAMCAIFPSTYGQSLLDEPDYYTIKGTVVDTDDNPIEGASVFIRESDLAAVTNDRGKFVIDSVEGGLNVLVCTNVGFYRFLDYLEMNQNIELNIVLEGFTIDLEAVEITTNRLSQNEPYAYSIVDEEDIEVNNLGQDLPYLVQFSPSVVVTSDAGAGIGYTGLRIRGSDPSRVNVTINGIPLNDSESQGVFWVDLPDFGSSVKDIQIQRGVGTSTNGSGAFGGTVGINTHKISQSGYAEINSGVGSFNTRKINARLGTGLLNNTYFIDGRFSIINSDGFIDRAESRLRSYYLSVGKISENSTIRFDYFSGQERTYQAWYGVPESKFRGDADALQTHYNNNLGSLYYNINSPIDFYNENGQIYFSHLNQDSINLFDSPSEQYNYYTFAEQVDRYQQDHYQFHWSTNRDEYFESNLSLHYTRGLGFFEQMKLDEDLEDYRLFDVRDTLTNDTIHAANLVRRKWLDNHFFGGVLNLKWNLDNGMTVHSGTSISQYLGDHYGNLIAWDANAQVSPDRNYYENDGNKTDAMTFIKLNYNLNKLDLFADLQYRFVLYTIEGRDDDNLVHDINDQLQFINPKLGLNYAINSSIDIYGSVAVGNREPDRNDYLSKPAGDLPKREQLIDYELGLRSRGQKFAAGVNLYYMDYKDQLVITGELNDVGANLRTNVPDSYRAGIEVELGWSPIKQISLFGNLTLSENKITSFDEILYDYSTGFDIITNNYSNTDIALSPNIISALSLQYQPVENAMIGFQSKYVGSQFLDNTSNLERSLDAYMVSNLIASYSFDWKVIKELRLNLQVNNIFNAKYASNGYTYSYIFGDLITENYVYPQAGINFLAGLSIGI